MSGVKEERSISLLLRLDLEFLESTPKTLINSLHATARNFDTPSYWTLTINLPDYSIYVYSDKNMVERILQNLLTNAIKYSVGTIKITLMEKENNNIIFTIENPMSDSSEIDCNRLFDRFYTGDKSRHNGSTGLGLAVVKTLVAILGGNIVAKVHANSLIITLEL